MIIRLVALVIGYLIGTLNLTYYISRKKGIDIRHKGSGNLGATNALRVMGVKAGVCAFIFDACKCAFACLLILLIFGGDDVSLNKLYIAYAGIGAVLGHCFPFYLGFKGGKGVASSLGLALVLDWRIALICFLIFIILVALSRYISLGSILSVSVFSFLWIGFYVCGLSGLSLDPFIETMLIVFADSCIVIIKHASNIVRLINGNENRLVKPEKK